MKTFFYALALTTLLAANAEAQVSPGTGGKTTTPVVSDPALLPILLWDPAGFSLNFSGVNALTGMALTAPQDLSGFSLNFRPVMEMLNTLKARGASIEMSLDQQEGFSHLNITVDGKKVAPIVMECRTCAKIEFEY